MSNSSPLQSRHAAEDMALYRSRLYGGSGVTPLRLPPDALLPGKARKLAKEIADLETEVRDRRTEVKRLQGATKGLREDHQANIATAIRKGEARPDDPTPAHEQQIREVEDAVEGARLAHAQATSELWSLLEQESDGIVTNLLAELAEKRGKIIDTCNAFADLVDEALELEGAVSFYSLVAERRSYAPGRDDLPATLRSHAQTIDDRVIPGLHGFESEPETVDA